MGLLLAVVIFLLCWRFTGLLGLSPMARMIGSAIGTLVLMPMIAEQIRLTFELIRDPMLGPIPVWPLLFLMLIAAAVSGALWCLRRGINPFDPFKS